MSEIWKVLYQIIIQWNENNRYEIKIKKIEINYE